MTTLTISAGTKEFAYLEDDGTFPATLVAFERKGPFDDAKKPGEQYYLLEWAFSIDDAGENSMVWIATGESTGPKSRTYGILSALLAGKQPPVGTQLDIEKHLIGRRALVTVAKDEKGYMKVQSVSALPSSPKAAAKPAAPAVADADPDDLPF